MPTVNVMDYIPSTEWAAIEAGTSTYDATSNIQSALNVTGRKIVQFPAGRLCQTDRLYLSYSLNNTTMNDITIRADACELMHVGQNNRASIWVDDAHGWRIQGLLINANRANRPSGTGESGIHIFNSENFILRDTRVVSTYADGLTIGSPDSNVWHRSRVGFLSNVGTEDNGRNGISFCGVYDVLCEHIQAKGNVFNAPKAGFAFEPDYALINENITLIEASSQGNGGHGLYLSKDANGHGDNVGINIIGGKFNGNVGWGILKTGFSPALLGNIICTGNGAGQISA